MSKHLQKDQFVWIKTLQKKGKIQSLNTRDKKAKVTHFIAKGQLQLDEIEFKDLTEYRPKIVQIMSAITKNVLTELQENGYVLVKRPHLHFARLREDAIIPSKRREDAGYDLYASFDEIELICPKGKTTLVPTGLCAAITDNEGKPDWNWYLNLKHERGSTAKVSISILAGVSDSGYRGEIFVAISPLEHDVIISKAYDGEKPEYRTEHNKDSINSVIIYPAHKAIAQFTCDLVVDAEVNETTVENIKSVPSERGEGRIGSSGK